MNALLPALNSPTTTSRKSSSSWVIERASAFWSSSGDPDANEYHAQLAQQLAQVAQHVPAGSFQDAAEHLCWILARPGQKTSESSRTPSALNHHFGWYSMKTGTRASGPSVGHTSAKRSRVRFSRL